MGKKKKIKSKHIFEKAKEVNVRTLYRKGKAYRYNDKYAKRKGMFQIAEYIVYLVSFISIFIFKSVEIMFFGFFWVVIMVTNIERYHRRDTIYIENERVYFEKAYSLMGKCNSRNAYALYNVNFISNIKVTKRHIIIYGEINKVGHRAFRYRVNKLKLPNAIENGEEFIRTAKDLIGLKHLEVPENTELSTNEINFDDNYTLHCEFTDECIRKLRFRLFFPGHIFSDGNGIYVNNGLITYEYYSGVGYLSYIVKSIYDIELTSDFIIIYGDIEHCNGALTTKPKMLKLPRDVTHSEELIEFAKFKLEQYIKENTKNNIG